MNQMNIEEIKAKNAAAFYAVRSREELEAEHGQVWDDNELDREYFGCLKMGPLALAIRRLDLVAGTLSVQNEPRFYHTFVSLHDK